MNREEKKIFYKVIGFTAKDTQGKCEVVQCGYAWNSFNKKGDKEFKVRVRSIPVGWDGTLIIQMQEDTIHHESKSDSLGHKHEDDIPF